jgi:glutamate--cysteine ligase
MTVSTKEQLDEFIITNWIDVNNYIDKKMNGKNIPFYTSVDIRESKTKYAAIDNNLYPAGFNNLCLLDLDATTKQINKTIGSDFKNIGILLESNTKNKHYLDNVFFLSKSIKDTGKNVYLISFDTEIFHEKEKAIKLESHSKFPVEIFLAKTENNHIHIPKGDIAIDFLVINNDQSAPISLDWSSIKTKMSPSPEMGWYKRQKIKHFEAYQKIISEFCKEFKVNENLLQAKFKSVHHVDFSTKDGLEELANQVDSLKSCITEDQKVFIKASKGTYGMGIHVVTNGEEVLQLNRKKRNKLDIGKNKIKFTDVLIQEGVETIISYDGMPAEVTIYLIGGQSVGGFMRANTIKDSNENLNSKGMVFKKFCISEIRQNRDDVMKEAVYSTIGRLSCLASILEHETTIRG